MNIALRKHLPKRSEIETLLEDIQSLRRDVDSVLSRVKRKDVIEALDTATEMAGRIGSQASTLYRDATRQGRKSAKYLSRQIQDEPAVSVLVAFGVGLLLSRLFTSRGD